MFAMETKTERLPIVCLIRQYQAETVRPKERKMNAYVRIWVEVPVPQHLSDM